MRNKIERKLPSTLPSSIVYRHQIRPGDLECLIYLHGILYEKEYCFNHYFEAYVAEYITKFVMPKADGENIWIAEKDEKIIGSIAIVKSSKNEAQLRWLLVHPSVRGQGIGRDLVTKAIEFCKVRNYSSVFLWTVSALTTASHLYQSIGFQKTEEKEPKLWGLILTEERYDLELNTML